MRRLFLLLLAVTALMAVLVIELKPRVPKPDLPSPEDIRATREVVIQLREASREGASDIPVPLHRIKRMLRVGARLQRGWRSVAEIEDQTLILQGSVPVPGSENALWLNVTAQVASFSGPPQIKAFQVGRINLPPKLAMWLMRMGLNVTMGQGSADEFLSRLTGLEVHDKGVTVGVNLDQKGRSSLARRTFGILRGAEMPEVAEIDRYYRAVRQGLDSGALPDQGSLLPLLQFVLNRAWQDTGPEGDLANAYTAAIFGLAKACGAKDFTLLAGRLAYVKPASGGEGWKKTCHKVRFRNRIDSRRHFLTASALQAASNRGVAVSVGEFKELFDSLEGSSGFDFTDIAANNSGIRLANRLMTASAAEWPDLLARIQREGDVIISFDAVPPAMTRAAFESRYGTIESPAYKQELARIEAQIDQLSVHQ